MFLLRPRFLWFEPFGGRLQFSHSVDTEEGSSSCLHLEHAGSFGNRGRHPYPSHQAEVFRRIR